MVELEAFRARQALEEQNTELARRYIEAINESDFDTLNDILSPDYGVFSPSGYAEASSREKLIENYRHVRSVFSKFIWNIEDIVAAHDKVICRILISGIYNGSDPDVPSPEKEFSLSLITIMRMQDGKIVEEWQEDDQLGFARQLGMELAPAETDE